MKVCDSASCKLCTGESCSRKTPRLARAEELWHAVYGKICSRDWKNKCLTMRWGKVTCATMPLCLRCVCDYIFNHVMCFLSFLLQDLSWCVVQKERYLCQEQACSYCSVPSPIALFTEHSLDSAVCFELHNFFSSWAFLWSQCSEAQCFTGIELTFAIWDEDIFSISVLLVLKYL